ncbi:MAG: T9SS type A sorting domain-containing protein [Paludibacter sp.]
MKKTLISQVFILFSLQAISQEINNCGHFIDNSVVKSNSSPLQRVRNSALNLNKQLSEERYLTETVDKLITITTIEQNIPSTLRIYSLQGKLLYDEQFSQIINPELTTDKTFLSFYCKGSVYTMNLLTLSVDKHTSSILYCLDAAGNPVTYDDKTSVVSYLGETAVMPEIPVKMLPLKDRILIFSRNNLYTFSNNEIKKILPFHGTFFDVKTEMDTLKYVLKEQVEKGFQFTLYKTDNLQNFKESAKSFYLTTNQIEKPTRNNSKSSVQSGLHENIRGPLNYSSDNVKYPIGNSYDELQDYGSGAYLHPGVDFLGNPNQEVYAVKTGVIKAVLTTGGDLYWRVGVANIKTNSESVGYLYAHMNKTSIPYAVGDSIYAGRVVGTIVPWPVTGFNHVHFARIKESGAVWDGNWWTVNNPLNDVTNLVDTIKPVFENTIVTDLLAFRDLSGVYLSPNNIHGNVDILSKVSDRCNSTYKIDVFELSYSLAPVSSPGTNLLNQLAFRFDMPSDDYIGSSVYSKLMTNTIYSFDQTCLSKADYTNRQFYHIITNSNGGDSITAQSKDLYFKSTDYPDGQYYFKVVAKDSKMNMAMDSMIVTINNEGSINTSLKKESEVSVYFYSTKNLLILKSLNNEKFRLTIYNAKGQQVYKTENTSDSEIKIETPNWQNGVYIFKMATNDGAVRRGKFILS